MTIKNEIFRAYDIRGIVDETLTLDAVYQIGKAFGSKIIRADHGINKLVIGRDGRLSGAKLFNSLSDGITSTGCDVVSIGQVATPLLYYASKKLNIPSAIMITGSHNPANYNGLKMILEDKAIYGDQILELKKLIDSNDFVTGSGQVLEDFIDDTYMKEISDKIQLEKPFKVAVDAGNGISGAIVPRLLESMGIETVQLFCEVDGNFPNHHPDPGDPKNLTDLIDCVKTNKADLGIAFDGDGDRLGIIDNNGKIIWPDRFLMAFAEQVLLEKPGSNIIYDIKSTNNLENVIKKAGGQPIMYKTGHSLIKAKMRETNAALAGEMSGHVFFDHDWYGFDDAIYASAKIIEIIMNSGKSSSDFFAKYPESYCTPEIALDVPEESKFQIMDNLKSIANFPQAKNITTIDGLRVDFEDSWGLVRCSNTTPKLILRFEGASNEVLEATKSIFKELLQKVGITQEF